MEQFLLNGQPVTIIGTEPHGECWIETHDGRILKLRRRGLALASKAGVATAQLRVDTSRGTDGAR